MEEYLSLLDRILTEGKDRKDRTGVGTRGVFGHQMRFDFTEGFPLLTTKKLHLRSIIHELLWFVSGETHASYLQDRKVGIWDEWATAEECAKFDREQGDLGPIYGHQWRNFGASQNPDGTYQTDGVDQILGVVEQIKKHPWSRRHVVTGWNPKEAAKVTLPPCHTLFQFHVEPNAKGEPAYLNCQLYQRSGDVFLGVPFNIASYSLLTMMVAQVTDLEPGSFVHTLGDAHLYSNHLDKARLQLTRDVRERPTMELNQEVKDIFEFKYKDFTLRGYDPHSHIKAKVAV